MLREKEDTRFVGATRDIFVVTLQAIAVRLCIELSHCVVFLCVFFNFIYVLTVSQIKRG
jgi:hypothetical protein